MDKAADAFRTISEVADHLDTPAHVLRFWESRFPQIRPVKRAGGRRYYRPSDISLLVGIKRLLHDEGMTIRGVQKILREQGVRYVAGLSGDAAPAEELAFVEDADDVVVPLKAEPAVFRPAPGLAEAMAKVVDHGSANERQMAPSTPLPATGPAQGALLLTPVSDEALNSAADVLTPAVDAGSGEGLRADFGDAAISDAVLATEQSQMPAPVDGLDDFDDEDFDAGPVITLASRIRSLPEGASASRVGADLLAVVARLQHLRDQMADAARADGA